jgi:hypothetical protein
LHAARLRARSAGNAVVGLRRFTHWLASMGRSLDSVLPMPVLTCPKCGNSGKIRGSEAAFEPRGDRPGGHWPIRKCRQCGAGIIVRSRFLFFGTRPTLIPDNTWRGMEEMHALAVGGAATVDKLFVCEACGRGFKSAAALDDHQRDSHLV